MVWLNVRKGYGYIHRDNKSNDILFHLTETTKNNPNKLLRSLAQSKVVQFYVVVSMKSIPEAAKVTGPNGKPVGGSKYAPDRCLRYNQRFVRQQRRV